MFALDIKLFKVLFFFFPPSLLCCVPGEVSPFSHLPSGALPEPSLGFLFYISLMGQ